ncbi:unnamed protein product [Effrenium voratum]|nr:unnamed protein product [Effrenium voratum]
MQGMQGGLWASARPTAFQAVRDTCYMREPSPHGIGDASPEQVAPFGNAWYPQKQELQFLQSQQLQHQQMQQQQQQQQMMQQHQLQQQLQQQQHQQHQQQHQQHQQMHCQQMRQHLQERQHLQIQPRENNDMYQDGISTGSLNFGVVLYDLETIHDAERGNYAEKGLHECAQDEQMEWKSRSQIIEFAAVNVLTGESICVRSRPDFGWEEVRSHAARLFAEDHGHADIVRDQTLPFFKEVWTHEVFPFLWRAAGNSGNLAMLAHNGDAFDHIILAKEIKRLDLNMEGGPSLLTFDPIRTLKRQYGPTYGSGGVLALRQLYQEHVPGTRTLRAHQAMDDCLMLLEVIQHWADLNFLLASDIASDLGMPHSEGMMEMLRDIA